MKRTYFFLCISLLTGILCNLDGAYGQSSGRQPRARALAIKFNSNQNNSGYGWNVLLQNTARFGWIDFSVEGSTEQQARQELFSRTGNAINQATLKTQFYSQSNGDIFYVFETNFARLGQNFKWVPVIHADQLVTDGAVKWALRKLHEYLATATTQQTCQQRTQPAIGTNTWLNISSIPVVKFFRESEPYGEFSNFYSAPITLKGWSWVTSENYFQAMKLPNHMWAQVANASPMNAYQAGQGVPLPANWDTQARFDAMHEALMAKFTQHQHLQRTLLDTGNAILVEDTGRANNPKLQNRVWGAGVDGLGENHLGRLLMVVRYEIRTGTHVAYDPQVTLTLSNLAANGFDVNRAIGQMPQPTAVQSSTASTTYQPQSQIGVSATPYYQQHSATQQHQQSPITQDEANMMRGEIEIFTSQLNGAVDKFYRQGNDELANEIMMATSMLSNQFFENYNKWLATPDVTHADNLRKSWEQLRNYATRWIH